MNEIAWLEFELAYFEAAVQHFSHYATGNVQSMIFNFDCYKYDNCKMFFTDRVDIQAISWKYHNLYDLILVIIKKKKNKTKKKKQKENKSRKVYHFYFNV